MNETTSMRMPVIFFAHGNPMVTLSENVYTRAWKTLAEAHGHFVRIGALDHARNMAHRAGATAHGS